MLRGLFDRWRRPPAGDGTLNAAAEWKLAQAAVRQGETPHAVRHLANALAQEPSHGGARALLDQIIASTPDPLRLAALDPTSTPYPQVAVRAYIHVQRGELSDALGLLANEYRAVPGLPFWPWLEAWLAVAANGQPVQPGALVAVVGALAEKLKQGADAGQRRSIAAVVPLIARYAASQPPSAALLAMQSVLVRELGDLDQAVALAQAAVDSEPGYVPYVMLGGALRAEGDLAAAVVSLRRALEHAPDDLGVRLDLGDLLCDLGQVTEGLGHYEAVLDRESAHPWALPSVLYYRGILEPAGNWGARLEQFAATNPDNPRARQLTRGRPPYLRWLPEPSDSLIDLQRQLQEHSALLTDEPAVVSALEAPSARLALSRWSREAGGVAEVAVRVLELQQPDPREPLGAVAHQLWRYEGTDPRPTLPPPDAVVAQAVAALAARPFDAGVWSALGREVAATLGPARLDDLLATMVHPPERPAAYPIADWIQRVQLASALAIAHLDTGWEGSLRQQVLCSLARGPLDWTVGAVIVALGQLALEERAARPTVLQLYQELLDHLPRSGYVCYAGALACWAAYVPEAPPRLRERAQQLWNVWAGPASN